ncbi:MAG: metallophosphoesterase, partial [Candidatus Hydrogenedentes bacterium]|nr:metallophosphoesterase [Candidatus Hydrogenedentota bacterium]
MLLALALLAGCPSLEPADLSPQPTDGEQHLFRLAHITDPQIVDEESPARTVRFTEFARGAWRPQEAFGIHTLDATLEAINGIHADGNGAQRPVDFVMVTGDLTDSAQLNELQWFVDTMDGAVVTPDSGEQDGVDRNVPPDLNPKLAYDATGLDPEIPWYTCFGNHDGLAVGNFPINRSSPWQEDWFAPLLAPVADFAGLHAFDLRNNDLVPAASWSPAILLGSGIPLFEETFRLDLTA